MVCEKRSILVGVDPVPAHLGVWDPSSLKAFEEYALRRCGVEESGCRPPLVILPEPREKVIYSFLLYKTGPHVFVCGVRHGVFVSKRQLC